MKLTKILNCISLFALFGITGCNKKGPLLHLGTNFSDVFSCLETPTKSELYCLGTIHGAHFSNKEYTLRHLQNIIENVKPDYIFIESREDTYQKYGVLDGPMEMRFLFAYGREHNIPVEMIDYWYIDDEFPKLQNSTWPERDKEMMKNIQKKLKTVKEGEKVLLCFGTAHYYYEVPKFEKMGFKERPIKNKADYLKGPQDFKYPKTLAQDLKNYIYYSQNSLQDILNNNIKDNSIRTVVSKQFAEYEENIKIYLKMVESNQWMKQ